MVICGLYYQSVYEITAKRKQAQTPISLKSGPFQLKFSEILQVDPKNNRSRASRLTLISIPATSYRPLIQTDVYAVLSMNELTNLTNVVIGKLGKLLHKQYCSQDFFFIIF
jgi:hypothetical protein